MNKQLVAFASAHSGIALQLFIIFSVTLDAFIDFAIDFLFDIAEVPVDLRGKIWKYLCMQWKLREECCCYCKSSGSTNLKLPNKSYDSLLKELTTHQHAILIDLGNNLRYFSMRVL